jgi:hypothetical protein
MWCCAAGLARNPDPFQLLTQARDAIAIPAAPGCNQRWSIHRQDPIAILDDELHKVLPM